MSQANPDITAEILAVLQSSCTAHCCVVVGSALVFYDHACTLSEEIEYIWERKMSSVIILFHLNRWSIFFWAILNFVNFMSLVTYSSCLSIVYLSIIIASLLEVVWAVFSAVRIYAISGRRWQLAAVIFGLSIVPIGTNMYADFAGTAYGIETLPVLGTSCTKDVYLSEPVAFALAIITRLCLITADILILLVTWYKTYAMMKVARQNNIRAPLAAMLLEDGTTYFIALLVLNVLTIVGNVTEVFFDIITAFTTPLQSIIVSHFLFSLRRLACNPMVDDRDASGQSMFTSQRSSLSFALFVDNMGEPLSNTSEPNMGSMSIASDVQAE